VFDSSFRKRGEKSEAKSIINPLFVSLQIEGISKEGRELFKILLY
jgi:hypothetical protein